MSTHHIPGLAAPAPGEPTSVEVAGRTVAVTVDDGQAYAFDDDARTHCAARSVIGSAVDPAALADPAADLRRLTPPVPAVR